MTLHPVHSLRFRENATGALGVAAGGAGWVDTDVSAIVGTDPHKVWVIVGFKNGTGTIGARAHGSAIDNSVPVNNTVTLMACCDVDGHMDLYRDPAVQMDYYFLGYLE